MLVAVLTRFPKSGRSGTFTYQHTLPEDPTELLDESEALLGMLK
jgi:hypothetical protein